MTRGAAVLAALLLAAGLLTTALASVRQPLGTGDFVAIWGLKARAIHRSGTLASVVRVDPHGEFSHPEYPPLWPVALAAAAGAMGRFDELQLTCLWPALAVLAALAAARATRGAAAARLLAAAFVSLLPYYRKYPGYAEALVAVFLLLALTEVDRLDVERAAPARLALLFVLAAWTKPEGALAGLLAAGLLFGARRRRAAALVGLATVALGVLPWALAVRLLAGGPVPGAFAPGAFSAAKLAAGLRAVAGESGAAAIGAAGLALLLALAPATLHRRRGVLSGTALFLVLLAGTYGFSRFDPAWHARWSWDRLLFLAAVVLAPVLGEAAAEALAAPEAEPRPA